MSLKRNAQWGKVKMNSGEKQVEPDMKTCDGMGSFIGKKKKLLTLRPTAVLLKRSPLDPSLCSNNIGDIFLGEEYLTLRGTLNNKC